MKKSGPRRTARSPLRKSLLTAAGFLVVYVILMISLGSFGSNFSNYVLDLLLCLVGFFFWVFFFAQFVLPLKRARERWKAFLRLFFYTLGFPGPAVRVENGEILQRKGETNRSMPGVIVLDTASAGVIRNPGEFKYAVGPGVAFTGMYESLAGVVDLHLQRDSFGPMESENPFEPQRPDENDPTYQARQRRRFDTQGVTRNGIPVVPRISVAIRLDADMTDERQRRFHTRFGYDPTAIFRAVTGRPVDLSASQDSPNRPVELTWLPLRLAADIWKECISRYTLEELFSFEPGQETALQSIVQEMKSRLTQKRYEETDRFGRSTGVFRNSHEYSIVKNKGIKVIAVNVAYVKLPPEIEDRLIEIWKSTWLIRARLEREFVEQQRSYETEQGKRSAMNTFAGGLAHFLGAQSPNLTLSGEQILRQLIRGQLSMVNQQGYVHRMAADEIDQLKEMLEWTEQQVERP